jgi:Trehalose-6-phosphate synthase
MLAEQPMAAGGVGSTARRRYALRASHEALNGPARAHRPVARGTAQLVVVTDRPPRDPHTGEVAPGVGLPDEPALIALQNVAARGRGVWVCRTGEVEPTLPLRRRLVDPSAAAVHDAGHAATLWPVYHDLGPGRYDPAWRLAFRAVNTAYADAAAVEAAPGATVWVYGHTLQLVPAILRRRRPDLRIGMYLPTHFPAGDLLRAMPVHREVMRGLLGADLVGFQTAAAAENFLRRTHDLTDQPPSVGVFPTAVLTPTITKLADSPAVVAAAEQLRARLGNPRTVILSVNPPEASQGVAERLLALGQAFADGRLDPAETVVIQIVLGRSTDPTVSDEIARAAASVNGRYAAVGRPPIHYVVDTPSLAERVAYYRTADLLLATPLREGATTSALEFVAAARDDAAVVLSELSGTATVLTDAFLVNPHDSEQVQAGITAALAAGEQRPARMARMRSYVTSYHTFTWAEAFLRTLRGTSRRHAEVPLRPHPVPTPHVVRATHRVRIG